MPEAVFLGAREDDLDRFVLDASPNIQSTPLGWSRHMMHQEFNISRMPPSTFSETGCNYSSIARRFLGHHWQEPSSATTVNSREQYVDMTSYLLS